MAADQRGQDGDLAAGVAAVHVVAGVLGLGVAQLLCDLQRVVKAQTLAHHLGEHEVGGAVHDALHLGDDIGRQALVHRRDDGRAAAHRSLEQESAAMLLGQSQQLGTVGGHHLLIGGAHTAAALETGLHIRVGEAGAADGLDHDLDLRVFQNGVKVLDEQMGCRVVRKILRVQDILDLHRFACAAGDARGVAAQHFVDTAAHRAKAQNCNFSHCCSPSFPYICDQRLYPQCTPTTMCWRESFSVSSSGVICMVSVRMVTATSAAPFSGVD